MRLLCALLFQSDLSLRRFRVYVLGVISGLCEAGGVVLKTRHLGGKRAESKLPSRAGLLPRNGLPAVGINAMSFHAMSFQP